MKNWIATTLLLMTTSFLVQPAYALSVQAVKGKRVLVSLNGESAEKGQVFYILRKNKRVGIIKVQAIKGPKALAFLGKGSAQKGDDLQLRVAKKKTQPPKQMSDKEPQEVAKKDDGQSEGTLADLKKKGYWGFMGGYISSSADVKISTSNQTVSMDGTGFSLKGAFDYPLFSIFGFRGMTGFEQLNASGGSGCSGECNIEVTYLTFDFLGQLKFGPEKTKLWAGGGVSLLFPMSKSSSALDDGSIANTNVFVIGGGVDVQMAPTTYIPFQLEYNMYPTSDEVEANSIVIRAGYMKKF